MRWGTGTRTGSVTTRLPARSARSTSAPPEPAVAIATGNEHTCALLDNGAVRCWGSGEHGALGYGNTATIGDDETPASVGPVDLGAGRKAVAITTGVAFTCALLDNGRVRCWGLGADGELGYATTNDVGDNETPGAVGPVDLGAGRRPSRSRGRLPRVRHPRQRESPLLGLRPVRATRVREHEQRRRRRDPGLGRAGRPRRGTESARDQRGGVPHVCTPRQRTRALLGLKLGPARLWQQRHDRRRRDACLGELRRSGRGTESPGDQRGRQRHVRVAGRRRGSLLGRR